MVGVGTSGYLLNKLSLLTRGVQRRRDVTLFVKTKVLYSVIEISYGVLGEALCNTVSNMRQL